MASNTFTITAKPGTDVWRKPPSTDVFNAPTATHQTTKSTAPLTALRSARVSFRLPKSLIKYDQAGLLLSLRPTSTTTSSASPPPKWLKTGVEFYEGSPRAATVACDTWADWSLAPVVATSADEGWVTVEVVSSGDELGRSFWVYQVVSSADGKEERLPLREVCWVFGLEGEWEVGVEAYACRPNKETGEELVAELRGFELNWA